MEMKDVGDGQQQQQRHSDTGTSGPTQPLLNGLGLY